MNTRIDLYNPIACVIQNDDGVAYDLLSVNVATGAVTSALLSAKATAFLTEIVQRTLTLLPGLSQAALQAMILNLAALNQLEGAFVSAVNVVGNNYALNLSGLNNPSNMQVTLPMSTSSPFAGAGSNAGVSAAAAAAAVAAAAALAAAQAAAPKTWDTYDEVALINTPSNVFVTMFQWAMVDGELTQMQALITGRDDVPIANVFDFLTACRNATLFKRVGGNATLQSQSTVWSVPSSNFASNVRVTGANAILEVSGDLNEAAHWKAWIKRTTTLV